ncbi:hypothetical protein [Croceitalea rosinachiae]|uniref:Histidine kinase N-terminal 7TM region domain-containing protein n=1 Tax=Croceitalea rosinachiae TaxID=3075596 RepID=A0ABU3AA14_9FLAO|nr:hypothetical protein [Croceitalea sp. F388]MDT0607027.1 hypothetical protein [Croceitalea sp. F388]
MNETFLFYGWWQFGTCLFAFVALLSIWWHIGKKQNDFGQVWLALSVLCWSISGLVEVYFAQQAQLDTNIVDGFRSVLSLFNSLFILLALPWFRYLPNFLQPVIKSKYWNLIVGLPFLFCLLPTINKIVFGRSEFVNELDVYYALLTLIFLGSVLWYSFAKRRLKSLAYLSLLCILITLLAQFYKLMGSPINVTLFSAIFKTSLIMIFFALALSWVKELSENHIPSVERLLFELRINRSANKIERILLINGFMGDKEKSIKLTNSQYDLLHLFAIKRKEDANGWLEIKPKNHSIRGKNYDISDYNEVKRLLFALLDGLFGKGNWSKEVHLIPLKETLFELSKKRERKIRLRLDPKNIKL